MKNLKTICLLSALLLFLVTGCSSIRPEERIFGVPKSTWDSLTPEQQNKAMDEHYKGMAQRQEQAQKIEEQRERNRPYERGLDLIDALASKKANSRGFKIIDISKEYMRVKIKLENGDQFEISPFGFASIDHWSRGQRIEISRSNHNGIFPVALKNLSNNETVEAKRIG